jgi:hypothetical protein
MIFVLAPPLIWALGHRPRTWQRQLPPPEVDDHVGIWCGGSWDPTPISSGEDPIDNEFGLTCQSVKTAPRPLFWQTMETSLGIVTLSKASSFLVSPLHSGDADLAGCRCVAWGPLAQLQ